MSKKPDSVRILAVRIAICTSLLPVSGPTRGVLGSREDVEDCAEVALVGRVVSVLCRPKSEMQRCLFTLSRSFELPKLRVEIRRRASAAVSCSACCSARRCPGVVSVVKSETVGCFLSFCGEVEGVESHWLRCREVERSGLVRKKFRWVSFSVCGLRADGSDDCGMRVLVETASASGSGGMPVSKDWR